MRRELKNLRLIRSTGALPLILGLPVYTTIHPAAP